VANGFTANLDSSDGADMLMGLAFSKHWGTTGTYQGTSPCQYFSICMVGTVVDRQMGYWITARDDLLLHPSQCQVYDWSQVPFKLEQIYIACMDEVLHAA